jgi:tetratricopeptide (TPR) repeat protein
MKKLIILFALIGLLATACHNKTENNPYQKAITKADRENYKEALQIIDQAISGDTGNGEGYYTRAFYVKEKTGDYVGAIEDYSKAITLFQGDTVDESKAYSNRGHAKYMLKDYKGALEDLAMAIRLNPDDPYIYRNRALISIAIKNQIMICFDLQKALDLGFTKQYGDEVEKLMKEHCQQ